MQEAEVKELLETMSEYVKYHGDPAYRHCRDDNIAGIDARLTECAAEMSQLREKRAMLVEKAHVAAAALTACIKRLANRI